MSASVIAFLAPQLDRMLTERDPAEDVGGQPLLSLVLLERLLPVRRGEGEDAGLGPGRQQAQEVPDVPHRLDAVHLAAGEQGNEERVGSRPVVAADEEPVLKCGRTQLLAAFTARAIVTNQYVEAVGRRLRFQSSEHVASPLGRSHG